MSLRRQRADDGDVGISSQGILQEMSEFAVPVWDMSTIQVA